MAKTDDRVKETTTTTGTGTVTLAGAVSQFIRFQDSTEFTTGDQIEYGLLDANGTGWETGIGTLASSTTFSRDTISHSSNSGSTITLSAGTHTIFATKLANTMRAASIGRAIGLIQRAYLS